MAPDGLWWERSCDRSWFQPPKETNQQGQQLQRGPERPQTAPLTRERHFLSFVKNPFLPPQTFSLHLFLSFTGVLTDLEAYWNNRVCCSSQCEVGAVTDRRGALSGAASTQEVHIVFEKNGSPHFDCHCGPLPFFQSVAPSCSEKVVIRRLKPQCTEVTPFP